jgi:hypothetical protein
VFSGAKGLSLNPWMGSNPAFQPHDTELGHQRQIFFESKAAEEGEMTASAHRDRKPLIVLGFELKGSAWMQFLVCVGGVFACSVVHDFLQVLSPATFKEEFPCLRNHTRAYREMTETRRSLKSVLLGQELVFRHKEFEFGWFMTLCELGVIVAAATFALVTEKGFDEIAKTPWGQYISLTIVLAITQGFGSVALSYVNYPVKVVIKSSKLIPTMALGLVVIRRSYSFAEYAAAVGVPCLCNGPGSVKHGINFGAVQTELISNHNQVMLCIGVAGFTLVDSTVQAKFHIAGSVSLRFHFVISLKWILIVVSCLRIALLVGAVFGDAMTANLQERILRQVVDLKRERERETQEGTLLFFLGI